MAVFRLNISRRGREHIAKSEAGTLLAVATSAEAVAEKARLALVDALEPSSRPEMLLLRIKELRSVIIVMQPFEKRVRLTSNVKRKSASEVNY
jgi:hypothetical protein